MLHKHKKWSSKVCLTTPCLQELFWWKRNCNQTMLKRSLHVVDISQHVYTDSSGVSFGGCWKNRLIQSKFSEKQAGLSINTKELLAIYYTLSAFGAELKGEAVLVHCHNTVSVSCIKKKGSRDPLRNLITKKIFHIAQVNSFSLSITWVTGHFNKHADYLSR